MSTNEWTPKDVFISYRRDERPRVAQIARALEQLGLTVWFDAALEPGANFRGEIDREVRSARAVLVCWSKGALTSEWVSGEALIGQNRRVLVPVFLEACELSVPFNFAHTEDLCDWSERPNHPGWRKVLSRIGALVDRQDALVRWAEAQDGQQAELYREFINHYPTDPLTGVAKRRVWDIELAATRQRLADELGFSSGEEPGSSHQLKELAERLDQAEASAREAERRCLQAEMRAREVEERLTNAGPLREFHAGGDSLELGIVTPPLRNTSGLAEARDDLHPADVRETPDSTRPPDPLHKPWIIILIISIPLIVLVVGLLMHSLR